MASLSDRAMSGNRPVEAWPEVKELKAYSEAIQPKKRSIAIRIALWCYHNPIALGLFTIAGIQVAIIFTLLWWSI